MNWSTYFIQSSLIWLLGLLFFLWWLREEKLPTAKRWLLLSFLIGAPLLSFIPMPDWAYQWRLLPDLAIGQLLPADVLVLPELIVRETTEIGLLANASWWQIIWGIGLLVMLIRLCFGWWQIARLYARSEQGSLMGRRVSLLQQLNSPFSYGSLLFWPKDVDPQAKDWQAVWRHELAHIDQKHSLDLLLADLLLLVFWWNPLVWIYRRELRLQHEILADAAAGQQADLKAYARQLINPRFMSAVPLSSHAFHHSFIKTRISMLGRPQGARWKLMAIFPLLLLTFWTCSQLTDTTDNLRPSGIELATAARFQPIVEIDTIITFNAETFEESVDIVNSEYYTEAEEFPVYGDCSDFGNNEEGRRNCSYENILQDVYSNIRYPVLAKDLGLDGMAVISFRITTNGVLDRASISRSTKEETYHQSRTTEEDLAAFTAMDNEALYAIQRLQKNWTPARINGVPVAMELRIPIKYTVE